MIRYLYRHFLDNKKQIILLIGLLLIFAILLASTDITLPRSDVYLNLDVITKEYNNRGVIIASYLGTILLNILIVDHERKYLNPIIAEKGRMYVAGYKLLFYLLAQAFIVFLLISILIIVPVIAIPQYIFTKRIIKKYFRILINSTLLTLFILIFARNKIKNVSYLITLLFLILQFIYEAEEMKSLWISYLLPLENSPLYKTTNGYLYLFFYIILLLYIYFLYEKNRDI